MNALAGMRACFSFYSGYLVLSVPASTSAVTSTDLVVDPQVFCCAPRHEYDSVNGSIFFRFMLILLVHVYYPFSHQPIPVFLAAWIDFGPGENSVIWLKFHCGRLAENPSVTAVVEAESIV